MSQLNADSEINKPKPEGGMKGFEKKESAMSQLTAEALATQGAVQPQPVSKVWVEVINPTPLAFPKVYTEADYENAAEVQSGSESYIETKVKPETIAEIIAKADVGTDQYVLPEKNNQTMHDSIIEAKAADTGTDDPSLESPENENSHEFQLNEETKETKGVVETELILKVEVGMIDPTSNAYRKAEYENEVSSESEFETEVKPEAVVEVENEGDQNNTIVTKNQITLHAIIEAKAADTATYTWFQSTEGNFGTRLTKEEPTAVAFQADNTTISEMEHPEEPVVTIWGFNDKEVAAEFDAYHDEEKPTEAVIWCGEEKVTAGVDAESDVAVEGLQTMYPVTKEPSLEVIDKKTTEAENKSKSVAPKSEADELIFNVKAKGEVHKAEKVHTDSQTMPAPKAPKECLEAEANNGSKAEVWAENVIEIETKPVTLAEVTPKAKAERYRDVAAKIETEIMPDAVIKTKSVSYKIQTEFEGPVNCTLKDLKEEGSAELQFNSEVEETKGVAEPYVVGCTDATQGDIQSRMAFILKARKKEDQMKKIEVEQRIKAGGDKVGYVDPTQGDIQSRLALKLKTRKVDEQRRKREEGERIQAGGDKVGYVDPIQGDIQLRMALVLKARKKEEQRRKREEQERIQAGGYKSGHVDPIQGDIQSRMSVKLKVRKAEEQRRKREEEERIKSGGHKVGYVDPIQIDIKSRMVHEMKSRKAEEHRRKREEEEHIKAGGHKVSYVDSIEGEIQSRMAHELKARKTEEQRRKREEEERIKAESYKMGFVECIEGDIQSRMALKLKARKIEEQKRKREEEECIKSGGSLSTLQRNTGLCMALKPKIKNSEDNLKYQGAVEGIESGGVIDTAHDNALIQMSRELQTRRTEERVKMFRMESDAELLALQGKKKEAMGQFASDQVKKGSERSSLVYTAELTYLEGKRSEAVKKFANRQTSGENLRNSQSQTVTELAALQGKRKEAEEQLQGKCDDYAAASNSKIRSPVAAELATHNGKKKEAEEQLKSSRDYSSSSSVISSPSPVTAELTELQGKRNKSRARLSGIRDDNRGHSMSSIQSTVCAELKALKGKKKEALYQYAIAKEQGNEDNWRDILSRNASLLSSGDMERRDASRHEVVYSPSITRSPSLVTAELTGIRNEPKEMMSGIGDVKKKLIPNTQPPQTAELEAHRGKIREELFQYTTANGESTEDSWRDELSHNTLEPVAVKTVKSGAFLDRASEMVSLLGKETKTQDQPKSFDDNASVPKTRSQSSLDAELTELEDKTLRPKSPFRDRTRISEQNKDPDIQSPVPKLRYQSSLTADLADLKGKELWSKIPFRGKIQTAEQSKDHNIQSPLDAELKALRGKKKKSMNEYLTFKGNGDVYLHNHKSRNASELAALRGKKTDAEKCFNAKRIIVEQKDGITLPLTDADRKYFQVKKVFEFVDKDHRDRIGRDEINLLLIVFGKKSGIFFTVAEIDDALNQVDAEGCGRIGFESFYSMYINLGFK